LRSVAAQHKPVVTLGVGGASTTARESGSGRRRIIDPTCTLECIARLVYSVIASLDGYVVDDEGNFDWAEPGVDVFAHVNDQEREVGTYLYGRHMYETMRVWQDYEVQPNDTAPEVDYVDIWRSADKVVFSSTLDAVTTPRTELVRVFDADDIRRRKEEATSDLGIGGPTLAAHALRAGLVDECHIYVQAVVVGGGTHWLPANLRLQLELLDERRFASGVVFLRYRISS
jgi:dihydrofolate reductase